MEPIWGRQDPGGPHVGPMNVAIWVYYHTFVIPTPYVNYLVETIMINGDRFDE